MISLERLKDLKMGERDLSPPKWIQTQVNLTSFSHWKTGGKAEFFGLPRSLDQYKEAISWALIHRHPITFLGQGSNSLISDQGIPGLVLGSKNFQQIEYLSSPTDSVFRLKCESGALKNKVMRSFLKQNLAPALFLSGIPGDVGGGVVMNAGVSEDYRPKEFCEIVESISVLKGVWNSRTSFPPIFEKKTYKGSDIEWSYRSSKNWQPGFIYEVILKTPNESLENLSQDVKKAIAHRRLKQPGDKPSCGSVFVNPSGLCSAGALIERAGLKGFQIGGAQVSYKHANFIVNVGLATSQDIHRVIEHVKEKVFEKYRIRLHTEVVYLGLWSCGSVLRERS